MGDTAHAMTCDVMVINSLCPGFLNGDSDYGNRCQAGKPTIFSF